MPDISPPMHTKPPHPGPEPRYRALPISAFRRCGVSAFASRRPSCASILNGVFLAILVAGTAMAANPPASEVEPGTQPAVPKTWGDWPRWGDQGDGTYRNPVLPSDYSDLDCIRVGSDYYAISSTFQYSPGMVILRSKDLVNWRIIGHVVDDVTQIGPELNWDRMDRYGRGVWAGAIRHHDGKFWVYFGTPEEGY